MAKARSQCNIIYAGASIQLYPDFSLDTLQKISYRWGFPFALLATKNIRSATLRTFEGLYTFCTKLD